MANVGDKVAICGTEKALMDFGITSASEVLGKTGEVVDIRSSRTDHVRYTIKIDGVEENWTYKPSMIQEISK